MNFEKALHMGAEEVISRLEELIRLAEAGQVQCYAARLFLRDGTWKDVVIGGTEQEQAEALAALKRNDD